MRDAPPPLDKLVREKSFCSRPLRWVLDKALCDEIVERVAPTILLLQPRRVRLWNRENCAKRVHTVQRRLSLRQLYCRDAKAPHICSTVVFPHLDDLWRHPKGRPCAGLVHRGQNSTGGLDFLLCAGRLRLAFQDPNFFPRGGLGGFANRRRCCVSSACCCKLQTLQSLPISPLQNRSAGYWQP